MVFLSWEIGVPSEKHVALGPLECTLAGEVRFLGDFGDYWMISARLSRGPRGESPSKRQARTRRPLAWTHTESVNNEKKKKKKILQV